MHTILKALIVTSAILNLSHCSSDKKDSASQGVLTESEKKTLQKAKESDELVIKATEERMKAAEDEK